jgi:predicted ATPase
MIDNYKIHNFKNHHNTSLDLAKLTILTGCNGAGKSSVLQTMLMLRESVLKAGNSARLNLRGDSFDIGKSSGQLMHWDIDDEPDVFNISFAAGGKTYYFSYNYPLGEVTSLQHVKDKPIYNIEELEDLSLFNKNFQYLSALRFGPKSVYETDTHAVDEQNQLSVKLGTGEFTVYYLSKYAEMDIPIPELKHSKTDSSKLQSQVEAWMGEISPGMSIKINQNNTQYELSYGYASKDKPLRYVPAVNTGFGISYILSVVVALLSAKPGSLILIENPEAHIHPAGQAALMRLITMACGGGVQVVLETHSDHIINGALVGAKLNLVSRNDISICFLEHDIEKNEAVSIPIKISEDCRIRKAPAKFFDQMRLDMETLFGVN